MSSANLPEIRAIIDAYDPTLDLASASTIPGSWYTDERIFTLERQAVFGRTWQVVGRTDQVASAGDFFTCDLAGEPLVIVRGEDSVLRGFHNVCRHHAAAVCTQDAGSATRFRCPYHGWTYGLDGTLKGAPDFSGVEGFDKSSQGLLQVRVDCWEKFVLVCLDDQAPTLSEFLGGLIPGVAKLGLDKLHFLERREYEIGCNWKVFVDNYLDGGYHVPYIHAGLNSVLDYAEYRIECMDRFCLQSSPVTDSGNNTQVAEVRGGDYAYYYWQYPNFMLNWYEGYMDTHVVVPLGVDRMLAVFDFYFANVGEDQRATTSQSVEVANKVQAEDVAICESVQRGLASRSYDTGRLSVRREAGEHLFHRLLHAGLSSACLRPAPPSEPRP
ncbi:MAG: aromatic ring-hydroxylating oxygenase subunit alpha [Planctomycetota bacterium]|jgi:choline monooxygenase